MDQSPLGQLPGETRNEIYGLVHAKVEELEVRIDAQGVAEDGLRGKLALATTCKQLRQETDGFPMTETSTVILKPNWSITQYGNKTLTAFFDLDAWLHSIKAHTSINPKRIILHVGELEVANLPDMEAWKDEVERIINRIPLEGLTRKDFVFAIDVVVSAHPALAHHHVITLPDEETNHAITTISKAMRAGWRAQKREVSSLMVKEWEGMAQKVLTTRRAELWGSLHLAEFGLSRNMEKLYDSLCRVRKGLPRHATAQEQKTQRWPRWFVHD